MFEHCLYFNTTSLARRLEREWSAAVKPFNLTPSQAFMLRVILGKQATTATRLAAKLNIAKATCSRTADGLIALGFVKRIQTGQDARSHELLPTAKARSIHAEIDRASGETTKKIKKIIGSREFETTVARLKDISASLG
jgi:DNA-binding MarR family transcriptional regulator